MKIQINKKEMKREWVLNKWYQKTIYVFGIISFILYALAFTLGLIEAIANI